MSDATQQTTAALFGDLWHRYDDELFEQSVALFAMRFAANGFDLNWFKGRRCLDAGCGGGRYSIAMARHGASEVVGCDISEQGLGDARRRAADLPNLRFEPASVLSLPFPDQSFDFACCSGVLHHTTDPDRGLRELTRVLRPGGYLFLLLYGTGGLRWPTIMAVRPYAQAIGYEMMDAAMHIAELPANKQRTFLDDFFVPLIRFYDWAEVEAMLAANDFHSIERWTKGKLDHEESLAVQRTELEQIQHLFETILNHERFATVTPAVMAAYEAARAAVHQLDQAVAEQAAGQISDAQLHNIVFGWGHHRVLAVKG